jgi:hypothetical protein
MADMEGVRPLSRLKKRPMTLPRNNRGQELRDKGYWPGAETYSICLWWNDDDDCVIVERGRDNEGFFESRSRT